MDNTSLKRTIRHLRARLVKIRSRIAEVEALRGHITDEDLERYHLGQIQVEAELASLEEHLLACGFCAERAERTADYVDAIRAAIIAAGLDQ